MCEGRIRGELSGAEATQEKIMTFATMRTTAIGPQNRRMKSGPIALPRRAGCA